MLPLIIHICLFLNVSYNYVMLVLQIADKYQSHSAKVVNTNDTEMETNEQLKKSLYSQTNKTLNLNKSSSFNLDVSTVSVNKLVIKNNVADTSMYNMRKPQIIRPERIRRKFRKTTDTEKEEAKEEVDGIN